MQDFLLMMENRYKTSASSTNSLIFLIKLRLDISNLLSTKKNPPRFRAGAFFLTFILYFVSLSHGFRKYILQAVTGTS